MKILLVVHYFLPRHQAGTEIYTGLLAQAFRELGHQVMIFTSEDDPRPSARFRLAPESWEGLPVFRLFRGEPPDFARSYTDPVIDEIFRSFLTERQPEVIHFQHTFRLSAGMIQVARRSGAKVALTLADFWFICPPILLLQPEFALCPGPEVERCARCGNAIGALYAGAPGASLQASDNALVRTSGKLAQAGADRAIRLAHALKRRLPRPAVEGLRRWKQARETADPDSSYRKRLALIAARQETMKNALAAADIVIAPSEFLRQKTIAAGAVASEKIIDSDYGFDPLPFQGLSRVRADHVRFGFIGTPVEHKGLHVAVAAMNLLSDTGAELQVHGDLSWFPAYARRLKRLAKNPRVRFLGRFDHAEIAKILSGMDALIAPSLWYENSPLTIHEAFLAQVPVIASDLGGMAELVGPGGGKVFSPGDPADLARVMRELIADPEEINRLRESIPPVKTIQDHAAELIMIYQRK